MFIAEDRVGSHVVIPDEVPLFDLQELPDILERPPWLQDEQEVDIPVGLLLGQWDVGLQTETDGGDDAGYFSSDGVVFCGGQGLGVLECVSSH